MDRNGTSKNNTDKKSNITLKKILRRPIVRLFILIVVIVAIVLIVRNCFKSNGNENELIGYQKLINVTDNTYTFVDLDGNTKTYEGYTSMDDFYYDVTCVSKLSEEDNTVTQMALINKNNKSIVNFGEYDSYVQVVGGKYYKVEKDGKYGVINYDGKIIINPEYDYISITTVQEATEVVFECQKENKYYFINEQGKTIMETESALHSISYSNKFNSEYDTVIYISVDGVKRYFNLVTGEELFADKQDVNFSYNILKEEGKISFYDKNTKLKTEIDTSADYSADVRVYFKKYVVLEQKNVTSGTREYKYTVYDSNFKQILESESKINPVQDIEGNVYFIINENNGVKIINENKKEKVIEGYEFNGASTNNLQFLVLNSIEDTNKYEVFNFNGKQIITDVNEYTQKGSGLLIGKYDESGNLARSLVLGNEQLIALGTEDNVLANDYYLTIEHTKNLKVSVVDFEGNIKLDKVNGTKVFYNEKYIGIQDGDNVNVYSVKSGKQTYAYPLSEYINRDETVSVVELTTGFYGFDGKQILQKQQ